MPVWPEARCPAVSEEAEVMTSRWQTHDNVGSFAKSIFFTMTAEQQTAIWRGRRGRWGGGGLGGGRRLISREEAAMRRKVNKPGRSRARALASHSTRAPDSHAAARAFFFSFLLYFTKQYCFSFL